MRVLIHIPSRGRPAQLADCVARFKDAITDKENTGILLTLDEDDESRAGVAAIDEEAFRMMAVEGKSGDKVSAINRDIDKMPWDVLVCASDDLYPMTPGFDNAIRKDFESEAADLDALFWYPDTNQHICCHPVIGRKYYERDGYVGHPSYRGFYVDDEWTIVARNRNRLFQSTSMKWLHLHPNYKSRKPDETDARAKLHMRQDYANFARRMGQGFPK